MVINSHFLQVVKDKFSDRKIKFYFLIENVFSIL